VNNAGIGFVAPMEEISLADLRRQYETNVFGVVRVTQQVLPGMRAQGRGRIVNMSSVAGKVSSPLFGAYSSSKFALESISDAWRLELGSVWHSGDTHRAWNHSERHGRTRRASCPGRTPTAKPGPTRR
jgi:NAD(P)-dependent dehydrogenase (short-subunit alcohol dehydrogenase family)